jgi:hypothetical protein
MGEYLSKLGIVTSLWWKRFFLFTNNESKTIFLEVYEEEYIYNTDKTIVKIE